MQSGLTVGVVLVVGMTAWHYVSVVAAQRDQSSPRVIRVSSVALEDDSNLKALVADIRGQADAYVFLSGGASRMQDDHQHRLLVMLQALRLLADAGRRIAVGDGGTHAGIMEAAGHARRESGKAFPLIGVAPASEVLPPGKTPIDPNHSHIVAVDNPSAPAREAWGSETGTMYWLFDKLAEGRPSITIVANGGGITLDEVAANVRAGRQMIVIEGSGRAAEAVVSLLRGTVPADAEAAELRQKAERAGLPGRPDLFQVISLSAGPGGLRDAIEAALWGSP